jgi:hypothetical protein
MKPGDFDGSFINAIKRIAVGVSFRRSVLQSLLRRIMILDDRHVGRCDITVWIEF